MRTRIPLLPLVDAPYRWSIRPLRYLAAWTIPLAAALSFRATGWASWLAIGYAFGLLPLLELMLPGAPRNLEGEDRERVARDPGYELVLWTAVPIQWGMLGVFLWKMATDPASGTAWWGHVTAMGLLCGVLGINVAHELGHRPDAFSQFLAKLLLTTSLYTHFFVEHNRGHHRNVATPEDPASARRGEWVYLFWVRSIVGGWFSAWRLERKRLSRLGLPAISMQNEVLLWQVFQWALLLGVGWGWGWSVAGAWAMSALLGGCLLETVNYIEHYGLERKRENAHRFERVQPHHSWNSDHALGRLVLFELSRHSDHHHQPAKPYAQLDHIDRAPQLPTGYPGMMLLSLMPPIFFPVMRRKLMQLERDLAGAEAPPSVVNR
jgi:alkane 1-monooxygenase